MRIIDCVCILADFFVSLYLVFIMQLPYTKMSKTRSDLYMLLPYGWVCPAFCQ